MGAWLLAALVAGCAAEPPEWTWVADGWGGFPRIEPVGREELVVVRSPGRAVSIDLLDVEGRTIWSRRIGGVDATMYAYGLAVGGDRTIYVGGWFEGVVTFGDEPRALTSHLCDRWGQGVPVYCQDGFVAAYAEDGQLRWVRRFTQDGQPVTSIGAVEAVPGGLIVTWGRWPEGFVVARLDAAGNEAWKFEDRVVGLYGQAYDLAIDAGGGILISAGYQSTGDGPTGLFPALVRLAPDGPEVWRRDAPLGRVELAADGDILLTEPFRIVATEPGWLQEVNVHRYDAATGERQWSTRLASDENMVWTDAVAIDPAGDLVILGGMNGRMTVGEYVLEAAEPADMFIVRLRGEDGQPVQALTAPFADGGNSLLVLDRDDLIIGGTFSGELEVDGDTVQPPPDMKGVFVRRGDPFAQGE